MYHPEHLCSHMNQIIDSREGQYVCCDCGLVISPYFVAMDSSKSSYKYNYWKEEIKDYLDRIHLPQYFTNLIYDYFDKNYDQKIIIICCVLFTKF